MKIITGLCKPDEGEVKIFGFNLLDQFEEAMQRVGSIVETASAYEYMSAYKNLKLAGRYYEDVTKARIEEMLELVGLSKFKNEKVGNYSLGMKQRLGLASAILSKPELVILDEPTNGLDVEGLIDIRNTIIRLAREQEITFFISSHLIHEVELMCNRIGIINNGELLKEGLVAELLNGQDLSLEDFFIKELRAGDNGGIKHE
jgi:ABC-2 type transport system ATP-binding protein